MPTVDDKLTASPRVGELMRSAAVRQLPDGLWFAEIPCLPQVWAVAESKRKVLRSLNSSLRLYLRINGYISHIAANGSSASKKKDDSLQFFLEPVFLLPLCVLTLVLLFCAVKIYL
ncbi:hypothetical protein J7M23_01585 [Candidatus Sumerlaeota bacterium]|nr:hypothetical protein [Candidatus Sumerlaeota bacterium]